MTSRQSGIILTAALVSVGVHAAAVLGFAVLLKPVPIEQKTMPKSRLNIQSQEVDRVKARPDETTSERVSESTPNARKAEQSAIKQSAAPSVVLPQAPVTAQQPKPTFAVAIAAKPSHIDVQRFKPSVVAAAELSSQVLGAQSSQGTLAPAVTALADRLQNSGLSTTTMVSLPLPAEKGIASLAWTGEADAPVEAASLAAIQAFMQPGDIDQSNSNIGELRDGIGAILASVPCARLQTTFVPETGALELRGHIPEDALRGPVLAALSEQIGGAIAVSDQLLILPRPQCGALSGIAEVGLPQSTEQLTNPRVIGADGFAQNYTYVDGQRLELDLVAPDYDSYVYVDYFAADGSVIHLQPNDRVPLEFSEAKVALSVGRDRGDKPSLDITVSAPFGQEIAAAFAASRPLYDGVRPLQEPAGPYLEFLKNRVSQARATDPSFKGEWVYFFISTKAQ